MTGDERMTAHEEYELNLERFQHHLVALGYGASTLGAYPRAVRSLRAFLDRTERLPRLREISARDLREFTICLLRDYQGSSATAYMSGLRRFFTFLEGRGTIDISPAHNVFPPKARPTPTRLLQVHELRAILRACSGGGFADKRDMALFRIFMATGARRSDVVGLRIDPHDYAHGDLDLKRGVVEFRDGRGATRRCALDPRTVRSLQRYLRVRATHAKSELPDLWITKYGGLTISGIYDLVMARAARAGVRGFQLHRLRITFAHRWLTAGGNPGDLMRILGLRSRKMIDRYIDATVEVRSVQAARELFRARECNVIG